MKNYVTTFDPFFDLFFHEAERRNTNGYIMDTDILDKKDHYLLKVNLPNVKKEDVKVSLEDGYLNLEAVVTNDEEEKDEDYIVRERFYNSYSRSYFVGDDIQLKDISAKMENGVLRLTIQKPNAEQIKKERYIEIK